MEYNGTNAMKVHELRHGGQIARKEVPSLTKDGMGFIPRGETKKSVFGPAEVDGYRAEYGYAGSVASSSSHSVSSMRGVTLNYVRSLITRCDPHLVGGGCTPVYTYPWLR